MIRRATRFSQLAFRGSSVVVPASSLLHHSGSRTYLSRAHARPVILLGLHSALKDLLHDVERRQRRRLRKGRRNNNNTVTPIDETVELALNLNLDPRKPTQSLRGSVSLPHGSGRAVNCLVFTSDATALESIRNLMDGSTGTGVGSSRIEVGGEDLVNKILSGEVAADAFQRGLATQDMQGLLAKNLARVLGPRGLMPNKKTNTLLETPHELVEALQTQMTGRQVVYRTEREGVVHLRVGRAGFGIDKLVDNIGQVMKEIFAVKPEAYGKGKKSSKNAKYLLGAFISSTQGHGVRIDLRTLDPSSPFFLSVLEGEETTTSDEEAVAA